jgi:hypothetical protein
MTPIQLLEYKNIILKKGIPVSVILDQPIKNLDACRFKIQYTSPKPLHIRFTFFDEDEEKSIYLALDVKDDRPFKLYTVAADLRKTFTRFEIHCDLNITLQLCIEATSDSFANDTVRNHFPQKGVA